MPFGRNIYINRNVVLTVLTVFIILIMILRFVTCNNFNYMWKFWHVSWNKFFHTPWRWPNVKAELVFKKGALILIVRAFRSLGLGYETFLRRPFKLFRVLEKKLLYLLNLRWWNNDLIGACDKLVLSFTYKILLCLWHNMPGLLKYTWGDAIKV